MSDTIASTRPLAIVTGAGPGTGIAVIRRLVAGGYRVGMIARSVDRLHQFEREMPETVALPCDVTDEEALRRSIEGFGTPNVIVHNAVGASFGSYQEVNPAEIRRNFDVNAIGLLNLARCAAGAMIDAGGGAIVTTGNTAALRGSPKFIGFAPTKAAQRILAESLARDLGPKGIHVAYLVIDASIDTPMQREFSPDVDPDTLISTSSIADEVFHLAHQPRDAWSFLAELRPYCERW